MFGGRYVRRQLPSSQHQKLERTRMKTDCLKPCLVILTCLMSAKIAANINLQNGNLLLVSGNVLVQVDRTGDVVDGTFLPFSAFDVAIDANGELLVAASDSSHPPAI